MEQTTSIPRAERAMERLDLLARVGADGPDGGVTRPGLSAVEDEAHAVVAAWCEEEGLAVSRDAVGNLYARPSGSPVTGEIWAGSHLDTVPSGGRFDGALGVVVALEAVAAVAAEAPGAPLAVVAFRDEEGWRFGDGCFGSRSVAGRIDPAGLARADAAGTTVEEALAALGLPGPPVEVALPAAYVEPHIEQGPALDAAGCALGDVEAIVGMAGFTVTFRGAAGHAGTVPMADRRDAFAACAELAVRLRERALDVPGAVMTIGDVTIPRPASNVIPGLVRATVDVRAPSADALDALVAAVPAVAAEVAARNRCGVDAVRAWRDEPVTLSPRIRAAVGSAARTARIPILEMASGGGHDAGVLAGAGVDAGMLFVRSLNGGVSHRPDELSDEADIAAAIAVLTGTLRSLL
ncbi:MAG TPA: hydantoinase/carbamoylase family amidase [Gaiellales bacterium]|nr:hydantoinase/carbamoylase family amidase [Gaiellales bacterium]